MSEPGLDFIGDVHGHASELCELLGLLGYRRAPAGEFRHSAGRRAVFVGDLIDRGPQIAETIGIVRGMVESGAAEVVLGNHEVNALCFHSADPGTPGEALRRHTPQNERQHAATLAQLSDPELEAALEWFRTWPFLLDFGSARVVHACWVDTDVEILARSRHDGRSLDHELLVAVCQQETPLCEAVENSLKGREMELPPGVSFTDLHGIRRQRARVRWFADPAGESVRGYSFPLLSSLPAVPLPVAVAASASPYPLSAPPVFFGHYWLDPCREPLAPQRPNVACLDFSVARGGLLSAYRWDGPGNLTAQRFVAVRARR